MDRVDSIGAQSASEEDRPAREAAAVLSEVVGSQPRRADRGEVGVAPPGPGCRNTWRMLAAVSRLVRWPTPWSVEHAERGVSGVEAARHFGEEFRPIGFCLVERNDGLRETRPQALPARSRRRPRGYGHGGVRAIRARNSHAAAGGLEVESRGRAGQGNRALRRPPFRIEAERRARPEIGVRTARTDANPVLERQRVTRIAHSQRTIRRSPVRDAPARRAKDRCGGIKTDGEDVLFVPEQPARARPLMCTRWDESAPHVGEGKKFARWRRLNIRSSATAGSQPRAPHAVAIDG